MACHRELDRLRMKASQSGLWLRAGMIGVLLLVLVAGTRPAAAAVSRKTGAVHARELLAQATFEPKDPSDCVLSTVLVQASRTVTLEASGGPITSTLLNVVIAQYDQCAGTAINAMGSGVPGRLHIGSKLRSASVSGTVDLLDTYTGKTLPATIRVTWKCPGPRTTTSSTSDSNGEKFITSWTVKSGRASGSVTALYGGTVRDFTSAPTKIADIDRLTTSHAN